ncbi:MAG: hypothetical protein Ct9H300mP12_02380 [Acidimicrobiales bacterium]|nr:MAG: hypothetical protein Ct9H300mP12_02380 [Acidimicrobiales bacterium]
MQLIGDVAGDRHRDHIADDTSNLGMPPTTFPSLTSASNRTSRSRQGPRVRPTVVVVVVVVSIAYRVLTPPRGHYQQRRPQQGYPIQALQKEIRGGSARRTLTDSGYGSS